MLPMSMCMCMQALSKLALGDGGSGAAQSAAQLLATKTTLAEQQAQLDGIAAQLDGLGATTTEADTSLGGLLARCSVHLGEVEQQAKRAQRTADLAGVSRGELADLQPCP